jgi:hypothetical protein
LLYTFEFLVQHAILAQKGVYEDPSKGTALCHRVFLAVGEREVESFGLCEPRLLCLASLGVGSDADGAATDKAVTLGVWRSAHGEVEVIDPGRDVYRVREVTEIPGHGHDQ